MGEINQPQYERELDYLYGNFSGKSALDKKIKNAEEILNRNKKLQEDNLERIFDQENLVRLKAMNVKDMSWQDVEILNEIKKRHSNVNKFYDGSDIPPEGKAVPDTTLLRSQIINTANELIPLIQNRGVAVQPIPEGASLQNILAFCNSFRDALKNSQYPEDVSGMEYPEDIEKKFTKLELIQTKAEIEKMLKKGQYL